MTNFEIDHYFNKEVNAEKNIAKTQPKNKIKNV